MLLRIDGCLGVLALPLETLLATSNSLEAPISPKSEKAAPAEPQTPNTKVTPKERQREKNTEGEEANGGGWKQLHIGHILVLLMDVCIMGISSLRDLCVCINPQLLLSTW